MRNSKKVYLLILNHLNQVRLMKGNHKFKKIVCLCGCEWLYGWL